VLLDKFNAYNSCAEVYKYSQGDKIAIIMIIRRIILRRIFRTWDGKAWTGSSWLRIGTGGVHLYRR
jgi:hypothetical protein